MAVSDDRRPLVAPTSGPESIVAPRLDWRLVPFARQNYYAVWYYDRGSYGKVP